MVLTVSMVRRVQRVALDQKARKVMDRRTIEELLIEHALQVNKEPVAQQAQRETPEAQDRRDRRDQFLLQFVPTATKRTGKNINYVY